MADKIFKIPDANSFRWTEKNPVLDPRFNTRPFDLKIDNNPLNGPYKQPWQRNDSASQQFLSDYVVTVKLFKWNQYNSPFADAFVKNIAVAPAANFPIQDVTFLAYEFTVDFHDIAAGLYYLEAYYTDDNGTTHTWQTSPLDVKDLHANTILYEYWNSENDKGIVFDTGIQFCFRVEGNLLPFTPASEDQVFTDQKYNTATESSIPYRKFENFIGRAAGVPDWVLDKINIIFSMNLKKVEGMSFNKASGGKFELVRPSQTKHQDAYMSIEIVQQENFNIEKYTTGSNTKTGEYKVITDSKIFDNVAASFSVAGVFKDNVNLIRVALVNKGLDSFTLKIGTAANGNDITEVKIEGELTNSIDIGHVFNAAASVFFTVPDGVNLKVTPVWEKYDAVSIDAATPALKFPKGYMGMYYEVSQGDFDIHWSATGTGNPGTAYEGCVILGTNGTIDPSGAVLRIWDSKQPLTRQEFIGTKGNGLPITRQVLPAEGIHLFSESGNPSGGGGNVINANDPVARYRDSNSDPLNYEMVRANTPATLGVSEKLGLGNPFDVTNYSFIVVGFVKLTD